MHHTASLIVRDSLVNAIFGLSALVLGFTFSNSIEHYDQRINIIRDQANVLSQVNQSIEYLNSDDRTIAQNRLKEILNTRLSIYQNLKSIDEVETNLEVLNDQLAKLNKEIIDAIPRTRVEDREAANQILRPQLASLQTTFQIGIQNAKHHPPVVIEAYLFVVLAVTALLSGYSMAAKREEDWFLTSIYLGLMGLSLYVIFALEYPNQIFNFNIFNGDLIRLQQKLMQ